MKIHIHTPFQAMVFCIIIASALSACIASQSMMAAMNGHFYKYEFAIREHTTRKPTAAYADKIFTVNFIPQYIDVHYQISNNSPAPIRIIWDKAYIVIHSDSSKIAFVPFTAFATPPSEIAARQSIEGNIAPADYIKNIDGKWTATEIYPGSDQDNSEQTDWIMGLLGVNIFKLYLPVESNGQIQIYPFTFYPIEIERSAVSQVPKQ